ncbi:MAG: hypothetical protein ACOCXJ_05430, partial [Planctomycetota bacterium]
LLLLLPLIYSLGLHHGRVESEDRFHRRLRQLDSEHTRLREVVPGRRSQLAAQDCLRRLREIYREEHQLWSRYELLLETLQTEEEAHAQPGSDLPGRTGGAGAGAPAGLAGLRP